MYSYSIYVDNAEEYVQLEQGHVHSRDLDDTIRCVASAMGPQTHATIRDLDQRLPCGRALIVAELHMPWKNGVDVERRIEGSLWNNYRIFP